MNCPTCSHENRPTAKFCEECGGPLRRTCAGCGAELRPTAKFCDECGTPTAATARGGSPTSGALRDRPGAEPGGARKVVTVVFADLAGSTALHERVDAESVRRLMERYYETLRSAVEEHGGTVVKLLGDGVMAAFGVPQVAEDDAVRAVRAGVAMQEAFRALLLDQGAALGGVGLRVAINTGEVVVSSGNDDVVGDPVNVAARLQDEAGDGDVVVGEATRRLVSALVTLAPLGSVSLKGRSEPVPAYRVESLERPAGTAATPFVGRESELTRLSAIYDAATSEPATKLAVLVGSPGLGKSRLIDELGLRLGDTVRVVGAHCNAAGGATFAPIIEALREALGIDASADAGAVRRAVEAALPGDSAEIGQITSRAVALLGGAPALPEETFFVIRRLLAGLAAPAPVMLVIDDLQWAEPLLLDLIEHLVQWGSGVPLLVLVGARPELRDVRSSLVTPGGVVSEVITLAGLDARAAMRLAAHVIGAADLPAAVAAKVLATSEGNPLFVGELVRMLVDEGVLTREGGRWIVGAGLEAFEMPPTIHALLAARIEKLRAEDQTILERAAVIGRNFSRNAVEKLLPGDIGDLDARLEALRRAELIERDSGWFLGEPVLRFHHLLIRDAAYRRLLKGTRAELHARFADWVETRVGKAVEHDETIGWHLEQACRLLGELGPVDERMRRLGERASRRLTSAGRRALARDDVTVAADLLGRAMALLDASDPVRAGLALDWCEALLAAGEVATAAEAVAELGRLAADDERLRAWHTCFAGQLGALTAPESLQATADAVDGAAAALARLGDEAGEAKAHFVHAQALARLGKVGACEAALDKALAAARTAGDRRRANAVLAGAPLAALWGPSPVTRASGRCLDVVRVLRITQGAPAVEAVALSCQGVLEALRGRTEPARRMIATARKMAEDLGVIHRLHETDVFAARIDLLEGKNADAARTLRSAYEGLRALGLGTDAAQAAALLGRALLARGRAEEAEALSREAEALAGDDLKAAIAWRGVRAEALAERGESEAAIELARDAVAIASATDALLDHADARLALAAALRAGGHAREAEAEEQHARELWEEKGATLLGAQSAERRGAGVAPGAAGRAGEQRSEPMAPAAGSRRRIRPNAASAGFVRSVEAIRARNIDRMAALVADKLEVLEHHNGTTYGRDGFLDSIRRMMRTADFRFDIEPLATLGESLALGRRRVSAGGTKGGSFDVAEYRMDHLMLGEVDAKGSSARIEVFASDHLGHAIARLWARYAERLPEGPERERAGAIGRYRAMWDGVIDPERLVNTVDPDQECIDHRSLSPWSSRGREGFLAQYRKQLELAEGFAVRDDDVLALAPDAELTRQTYYGTARDSGGAFENHVLVLTCYGPTGLTTRAEVWDPGQAAEALARFDELTGGAAGPGSPGTHRRHPRPNAATRSIERFASALYARDREVLAETFDEKLTVVHHPGGATYGRREMLATWKSAIRAEHLEFRNGILATLGDTLALEHHVVSVEGLAEAHVSEFGRTELDEIALVETDVRGCWTHCEIFAAEQLARAVSRLYERYAEALPEGPERDRASTTARSLDANTRFFENDVAGWALSPDVEMEDHRLIGTWNARGIDEVRRHARSLDEIADGPLLRDLEVLALTSDTVLTRRLASGTSRLGGGTYERHFLILLHFGRDGRLANVAFFDVQQEAAALARFDELAGVSSPSTGGAAGDPSRRSDTNLFENAATRLNDRYVQAWAEGDFDTVVSLYSPGASHDDRRHLMQFELSPEENFAGGRFLFDQPNSRISITPVATRGERLALSRAVYKAAAAEDGGPLTIEYLVVSELGDDGRFGTPTLFNPDDVDAAYAELDRRYLAGEGAGLWNRSHGASAVDALNQRAWNEIRAMLAPDFYVRDHRKLGWGDTLENADALIRSQQALVDLAPDSRYRIHHIRRSGRAVLLQLVQSGTRDGGAFENPMLQVTLSDHEGRMLHYDIYDLEDYDAARARFEQLRAGEPMRATKNEVARSTRVPEMPENVAAWLAVNHEAARAMKRWEESFARGSENGDWDRMRAICAPGMTFEDRQRLSLVSGDCELMIASARERVVSEARPELAFVGTAGDRVVIAHLLWSGGPEGGRFEIEYYALMEVDESGLVTAIILMDVDQPDRVWREARTRWQAIDPVAEPWIEFASRVSDPDRAWEAFRSRFAETLVVEDQRRTGMGRIDGRDAYLDSIKALWKLAPDTDLTIGRYWLGHDSRAAVASVRRTGNVPDGGEYESDYLSVMVKENGLMTRFEMFETDALERALARYEDLRAGAADGDGKAAAARASRSR